MCVCVSTFLHGYNAPVRCQGKKTCFSRRLCKCENILLTRPRTVKQKLAGCQRGACISVEAGVPSPLKGLPNNFGTNGQQFQLPTKALSDLKIPFLLCAHISAVDVSKFKAVVGILTCVISKQIWIKLPKRWHTGNANQTRFPLRSLEWTWFQSTFS